MKAGGGVQRPMRVMRHRSRLATTWCLVLGHDELPAHNGTYGWGTTCLRCGRWKPYEVLRR